MTNTYTEWAQDIINQLGVHGANKLIYALNEEIKKKENEAELDRKAQQHQEDEFYDEFSPKSSDFI